MPVHTIFNITLVADGNSANIKKQIAHALALREALEKAGVSSASIESEAQPVSNSARVATNTVGKGKWETKYIATYGILKSAAHWPLVVEAIYGEDTTVDQLSREEIAKLMFELRQADRLVKDEYNRYFLDGVQLTGSGVSKSNGGVSPRVNHNIDPDDIDDTVV